MLRLYTLLSSEYYCLSALQTISLELIYLGAYRSD
jgi:hypothetical protein